MALSMTGFGRGEYSSPFYKVKIEIRSVNHRYLDLSFRIPRAYQILEDKLRTVLNESLARGKVDITVAIQPALESEKKVEVDWGLADGYVAALNAIKERYGLADELSLGSLQIMPDIIKPAENEQDLEVLWDAVQPALMEAIETLLATRKREGSAMAADVANRLATITELTKQVAERAPAVTESYRNRLEKRLAELDLDVMADPARIATEIALYADRTNIDEEITRLQSHLVQGRDLLKSTDSIGRRFDFLLQELNREANTIGSKANDLALSNIVIEVKSELEKIREQIQNIE
ncbi:MAG TPA: YicC family protein [Firmicutes bacterium]|nr:YicC family protein [Bacillota bacterium]HAW70261.1 YicC family protein [Bacillota bacterium]HAZ22365.1 YicC family protein [Bacillota bacterium]HBG44683.1 YicC family protein [Bacillota bacterium]HBL51368.1 YicC family protein [Bacillota bacterium]